MIISGFSFATSSLVGNCLGASQPKNARIYANISLLIALFICFTLGFLMYILRVQLSYFFTEDDELAHMVSSTIPIIILMTLADDLQGMAQGIIKAMGYQKYATYI